MLTTNRSPSTEATAAHFRQVRQGRARLLSQIRRQIHADPTDADAREYLAMLRAESCQVPNPDRRRDCARHAARALEIYNQLSADHDPDSVQACVLLDMAARSADELATLQLTARH